MKHLIAVFFISTVVCSVSYGQRVMRHYEYTATDTLPSVVAIYADGDIVSTGTNNVVKMSVEVPIRGDWYGGFIYQWKLEVDSVSANANFDVYAMYDTTGYGALKTANNGVMQGNIPFDSLAFCMTSFTMTPLGTWAAGARRTWQSKLDPYAYAFPAGKNRMFFVVVARGAWTPKQNGVIKLTVTLGE